MGVSADTMRLLGGVRNLYQQRPCHQGDAVRWDCPLRVMEGER